MTYRCMESVNEWEKSKYFSPTSQKNSLLWFPLNYSIYMIFKNMYIFLIRAKNKRLKCM